MKEEALEFLRQLAQSQEAKNNRGALRDTGSALYRIFPSKEFRKEVEAITVQRQAAAPQASGAAGVGAGWKVRTPKPKGDASKNVVTPPAKAVVGDKKGKKPVEKEEEVTDTPILEYLDGFGIGPETYEDLTKLDHEQFITELGSLENAQSVASALGVKGYEKMAAPKLVKEIQKGLKNAYSKDTE